jgi:hypothetical protein
MSLHYLSSSWGERRILPTICDLYITSNFVSPMSKGGHEWRIMPYISKSSLQALGYICDSFLACMNPKSRHYRTNSILPIPHLVNLHNMHMMSKCDTATASSMLPPPSNTHAEHINPSRHPPSSSKDPQCRTSYPPDSSWVRIAISDCPRDRLKTSRNSIVCRTCHPRRAIYPSSTSKPPASSCR